MWVEALKSCREYLPTKLDEVQAEYDRECGARVTRDINSLFVQASQWEQNGEFKTAVDCLLKVRQEWSLTVEIFIEKKTENHILTSKTTPFLRDENHAK